MENHTQHRMSAVSAPAYPPACSEIEEYLDIRQQRGRVFPRAALVGVCAGGVALLFRMAVMSAAARRNEVLRWAHRFPAIGWIFPVGLALTAAGAAVALTRRYAPEARGSGIPHLEAVLCHFRELNWVRLLPVKFLGGILGIGGGLALGREGPTVQMGGAVGDGVSRLLKSSDRERLTLISAGAGAGLAAAFNAPLAGVVFVLEELRRDFQPVVFGAAFVAAVTANIIARIGSGQFPIFSVPDYPVPPLTSLPVFALLGVAAGLLGVLFNRILLASVEVYGRVSPRMTVAVAALTGGVVGLAGWFSPLLPGSGDTLVKAALSGDIRPGIIPLFLLIRLVLTVASYGTGAPGGIFAPLLVLGALLGLSVGHSAHTLFPAVAPTPGAFAVVGMAACFTGIVRAPLTGIVLIAEMTGSYSQMLPLLVSCFAAYAVAEFLKETPIYEALMERDLARAGESHLLQKAQVVEFIIEPHAPFDGREIRALGLPPGCIIVQCAEGRREWVPRAGARLTHHMRITVVVDPAANGALERLRWGCRTPSSSPTTSAGTTSEGQTAIAVASENASKSEVSETSIRT